MDVAANGADQISLFPRSNESTRLARSDDSGDLCASLATGGIRVSGDCRFSWQPARMSYMIRTCPDLRDYFQSVECKEIFRNREVMASWYFAAAIPGLGLTTSIVESRYLMRSGPEVAF